MAAIQLTQVYLAVQLPLTSPALLYKVQGSESPVAINPLALDSVGPTYQADGSLLDVRSVKVAGAIIFVTDTYAAVKAAIDAL